MFTVVAQHADAITEKQPGKQTKDTLLRCPSLFGFSGNAYAYALALALALALRVLLCND